MNGLLALLLLLLGAAVWLLTEARLEVPETLFGVFAASIAALIAFNTTLARFLLLADERGAEIRLWPWRRRIGWRGATLQKIVRPIGVTAVRLIGANGKRIWVSAGWFRGFQALHDELERRAAAGGARVTLVGK